MTSKTEAIFKTTAPYANIYQGDTTRLLFVCSAGLLRSPTAANVAIKLGYNARSCGTSTAALIPCSMNLLKWADHVIFVNFYNKDKAAQTFRYTEGASLIKSKSIVWDIPDDYDYDDARLVKVIEWELHKHQFKLKQERYHDDEPSPS